MTRLCRDDEQGFSEVRPKGPCCYAGGLVISLNSETGLPVLSMQSGTDWTRDKR